ncbi:MAG: peptidoglycan/LPS O-acetylase OafA/YrhL [Acidimicrobiales bacterium]|jgi:peptidoglycan/LPS O-acetylase OafA/YrhL
MSTATASATTSLGDLAGSAKPDRNRAVDLYRAVAMAAVAFGHWMAIAISADADGNIVGGNALEQDPSMSWVSWLLQVMPLFFVVGGFSSAISLDAHNKADGARPQDWVVARLRRMLAPAVVLAGTWVALFAGGFLTGTSVIVSAGALAAAIPLWFLSNYTIDTAIAPYVLPRFRANPARFAVGGLGLFGFLEMLRFAEVPVIPHLNWVLGWLLFQVAGFAWRDGLLPTGRPLAALAGALWIAALAAVTVGPYPLSMVNFPNLVHSPTHPPTLALLLFGAAYSATAIFFAPAISSFLATNVKAWAAVVAANSFAVSVYLWHMTAAVAASAVFYALGALPTAAVGTTDWWIQKVPLLSLSLVFLVAIVAVVSRFERKALLAPRVDWNGGQISMLACAAIVSASIKLWAGGDVASAIVGSSSLLVIWFWKLRAPSS